MSSYHEKLLCPALLNPALFREANVKKIQIADKNSVAGFDLSL
jgi:hypothetical protein